MADIKKIATLAINMKPASRKQAFETVLDIIENGPTDKAIAALYSYFLPKQPHKAKTAAAWLVRALADKKDMRKYLQHVFCDGNRLMATAARPAGHMPKSNWLRQMKTRAERNAELAKRRSELWEEYQRLMAEGKVRTPTRIERLIEAANGHEDRAQTHAARRVLAKRGIDWRAER